METGSLEKRNTVVCFALIEQRLQEQAYNEQLFANNIDATLFEQNPQDVICDEFGLDSCTSPKLIVPVKEYQKNSIIAKFLEKWALMLSGGDTFLPFQ